MDLKDFMNAICTRAPEGHTAEDIAAQARAAGFPIEHIRDEVAVSLAITALDGTAPTDEVGAETEEFILEQRAAARQYARLLLELYPKRCQ